MQYSLKELRARKKVTQKDLAYFLGVTEQSVVRWEKEGIDSVKYSVLQKIADYFSVKISELK